MPAPPSTSETLRRSYARATLAAAGVQGDAALEAAFAAVPRENFLFDPPSDLSNVYSDDLFALDREKGINNGQPSLHAGWLREAALKPAERVAHIGAGAGYYSAILAELVGASGAVLAVEFDQRLAQAAKERLAPWPQARVVQGDGAAQPQAPVDVIYVNFGVERPAPRWLDQLRPGGRLIFPLLAPGRGGAGVGLKVERVETGFAARALAPVRFIAASGANPDLTGPPAERAALAQAFRRGDLSRVRSLLRRPPADPARCLFVGEGWALSRDPP